MTYATFAGSSAPSLVTLDANFAKAAEQVTGTFTPTISGTSTAGTGTYTSQNGRYTAVGNVVYFSLYVSWTAHTGTGNIVLTNVLPIGSASGSVPSIFNVMPQLLNYSGNLVAFVGSGSSTINIRGASSGAILSVVPMDAAGEMYISGCYESA